MRRVQRVCPTRVMAISSVPDLSDACTSIPRRGSSATTPDGLRDPLMFFVKFIILIN